jgi:hypothetical protein
LVSLYGITTTLQQKIDERRISFLKEQIKRDENNKPEVNKTFQIQRQTLLLGLSMTILKKLNPSFAKEGFIEE